MRPPWPSPASKRAASTFRCSSPAARPASSSSALGIRPSPKAASACAPPSPRSASRIPAGRLVVNLAPADLPKEGTHYDLPIALAMMAAIGALPHDALDGVVCFGEVGLDGALAPAPGALPAAMAAHGMGAAFICPEACGAEAAWAGGEVIAAPSLLSLVNHFRGGAALKPPERGDLVAGAQRARSARRARPGAGQARARNRRRRRAQHPVRRPARRRQVHAGAASAGLVAAAVQSEELLEVSMLHSVAGLARARPLDAHAPVPRAAPFRVDGRACRRRIARQARRNLARAPRRAVPR